MSLSATSICLFDTPSNDDSATSLGSLQMLDNPFGEEFFPNIQPKYLLAQLVDVSSPPFTIILCKLGLLAFLYFKTHDVCERFRSYGHSLHINT